MSGQQRTTRSHTRRQISTAWFQPQNTDQRILKMSNFKMRALAGASAIAALSAFAVQADASTIVGGGSTLLQPYFAQANSCGNPAYTNFSTDQWNVKPGFPVANVAVTASTECSTGTGLARVDYDGPGS